MRNHNQANHETNTTVNLRPKHKVVIAMNAEVRIEPNTKASQNHSNKYGFSGIKIGNQPGKKRRKAEHDNTCHHHDMTNLATVHFTDLPKKHGNHITQAIERHANHKRCDGT